MKSIKIKIIVTTFLGLAILAIGGVFYYASQKIDGEELKQAAVFYLQKTVPNADIQVGKVGLNMGTSVKLFIKGVSLRLPQVPKGESSSMTNLFHVEDVEIKIPIFAILGKGGHIKILLEKASLNYGEFRHKSNWRLALKKQEHLTPKSPPSPVSVPTFLSNSKVNLHFKNMLLTYTLRKGRRGRVNIRGLKVNNLGLRDSAAYELNSNISLNLNPNRRLDTDMSLIGQFKLEELMSRGFFSTTSVLNVKKLEISDKKYHIPPFKTNLELNVSREGDIKTKLSTTFNEKNHIGATVDLKKSRLYLRDIDLKVYMRELAHIFNLKHSALDYGSSQLSLKGTLDNHPKKGFQPDLTFHISPQVRYSHQNMEFNNELRGTYKGKSLILGTTSKSMGGILYSDWSIHLDLNKKIINLSKMKPFKISLTANGMNIPPKNIRRFIYEDKAKKPRKPRQVSLPRADIDLTLKNLSLGGEPFSGKGKIFVGNKYVKSSEIKFKFTQGNGKVSFAKNFYRNGVKNIFSLNLNDIRMIGLKAFLPDTLKEVTGTLSGKASGKLSHLGDKKAYDINVDLKAQRGELKGIDLEQHVSKLLKVLSHIPGANQKIHRRPLEISDRFRKFSLTGRFKENHFRFKHFSFIGHKGKIDFSGRGDLYPVPKNKKSFLTADVKLSSSRPFLMKNFGMDKLTVQFSGPNFSLKPNLDAMGKYLTRLYFKKQQKKATQKAKAQLGKKIDDLLKGKEKSDKVKKLLKGLL